MAPDDTDRFPCPIATMDAHSREFLAPCHAEAHERAVQVGRESSPCAYCGRDYEWHVREVVYERCEAEPPLDLVPGIGCMMDLLAELGRRPGELTRRSC